MVHQPFSLPFPMAFPPFSICRPSPCVATVSVSVLLLVAYSSCHVLLSYFWCLKLFLLSYPLCLKLFHALTPRSATNRSEPSWHRNLRRDRSRARKRLRKPEKQPRSQLELDISTLLQHHGSKPPKNCIGLRCGQPATSEVKYEVQHAAQQWKKQ